MVVGYPTGKLGTASIRRVCPSLLPVGAARYTVPMNRLDQAFAQLRAAGRRGLLPYITAGYPDCGTTVEILARLDPAVCVAAEVGIPFSDPIADGPVIQTSFARALAGGFRCDDLLAALRVGRGRIAVPVLAMVSYSIVYRRGPARFVRDAVAAGLDGLIVPDLAVEEAAELSDLCAAADCGLVLLVAPTTEPRRRAAIAALSRPFLYYQALAGVTGERSALPADLAAHVAELRGSTGKPICIGFGISTADHVAQVCEVADGAIVGSALVRRMNALVSAGAAGAAVAEAVAAGVAELARGLPAPRA